MKVKITLLIVAAIALTSFNSCAVRVGGHVRVPRERHERHDRGYVQPLNNGLQNSFTTPSIFQPSTQVQVKNFSQLNFD